MVTDRTTPVHVEFSDRVVSVLKLLSDASERGSSNLHDHLHPTQLPYNEVHMQQDEAGVDSDLRRGRYALRCRMRLFGAPQQRRRAPVHDGILGIGSDQGCRDSK